MAAHQVSFIEIVANLETATYDIPLTLCVECLASVVSTVVKKAKAACISWFENYNKRGINACKNIALQQCTGKNLSETKMRH